MRVVCPVAVGQADRFVPEGPVRVELRRDAGRVGPDQGPWIRRNQIARFLGVPDPHAMAQVLDRRGDIVGWGLISPVSNITVRLLVFGAQPPSATWLTERLAQAFAAREIYRFEAGHTTGYRLVNSEGDGLPGLVIDRYGADLVVQLTTAPMAAREDQIVSWLRTNWKGAVHVVVPEAVQRHEGVTPGVRNDDNDGLLRFHEYGLQFAAPAPPSQKTGAYFDQRVNRRLIASIARQHGGPLLDLGCHIGGFALHARKAGVEVTALDQSQRALALAADNAKTNNLGGIEWVHGDMFEPLNDPRLAGPFGTIVFDPPKLGTRKTDVDRAADAMGRVCESLSRRLLPGGHLVLCSCSHHIGRQQLDRVAAKLGGRFARVMALGPGPDHPVAPCHAEGEYLRVNVYQLRDCAARR